ncbi:hypothetical protein HAX54_051634, partial [Datura stramonium]|nr:hypothetical protein [Datura stramonium]
SRDSSRCRAKGIDQSAVHRPKGRPVNLAFKGFHEADLESPSKREYLRLREYYWCRKSQIQDLPLREFPEKRSHRHVGSGLDRLLQENSSINR